MLSINDHSRDSAGMKYVYPVLSRRAGGVSVGINLNVNNACNWTCIYCQVPNLKRGGPPPIDLAQLKDELRQFLHEATQGDFLAKNAPPEARRLVDLAFSGNGEPTSAEEFSDAIDIAEQVLRDFKLEKLKLRLITNGSLMHRPNVQNGIARIGKLNGEICFILERATETGIEQVNGIRLSPSKIKQAIVQCASLAPTWIQTCYFALDGNEADQTEQSAYLALLDSVKKKIKGVHLYGLARPSLQPQAMRLSSLSQQCFMRFAESISALGVKVIANP